MKEQGSSDHWVHGVQVQIWPVLRTTVRCTLDFKENIIEGACRAVDGLWTRDDLGRSSLSTLCLRADMFLISDLCSC